MATGDDQVVKLLRVVGHDKTGGRTLLAGTIANPASNGVCPECRGIRANGRIDVGFRRGVVAGPRTVVHSGTTSITCDRHRLGAWVSTSPTSASRCMFGVRSSRAVGRAVELPPSVADHDHEIRPRGGARRGTDDDRTARGAKEQEQEGTPFRGDDSHLGIRLAKEIGVPCLNLDQPACCFFRRAFFSALFLGAAGSSPGWGFGSGSEARMAAKRLRAARTSGSLESVTSL